MQWKAESVVMLLAVVLVFVATASGAPAGAADGESVEGRFWYELASGENTYAMDLDVVDGVAVPTEFQGGERVRVVLVGEPLDRERFMEALADTGSVLFASTRLGIDQRVEFDVCRYQDGSEAEICGFHVHGPGLSKSASGFGVYDRFTEVVHFEDGRVRAKLRTEEPENEENLTFGFDLTFYLPITP